MRPQGRALRASIAGALVSVVLVLPLAAEKGAPARQIVRITNFGQINSKYYRGAQPKGGDYADLATFGVKTIIDLTQDGDANEPGIVKRLGMNFYRIPMTTHRPPTPEQIALFLKVVNDPASQPVYVHCQGGRHRTGVMTAIFRMTHDGWTGDQAFTEMKQYNYGPDVLHPEFKRFVYAYTPAAPRTPPAVVAVGTPVH